MTDLQNWDRAAFITVNSGTANPVLDVLMPLLRYPLTWVPVYVFLAAFLIYNFREKGLLLIAGALLTFLISDQLSAHVLKFLFMRPRPCNDPVMAGYVRLLVPCGSGYSLPSSHATNHFALSLFLITALSSRLKWILPFGLLWAATVSYAQVYVGLHFPIDVIFGGLLGGLIGIFVATLTRKAFSLDFDKYGRGGDADGAA